MSEYSAAFQSAKVAVTWLKPAFNGDTSVCGILKVATPLPTLGNFTTDPSTPRLWRTAPTNLALPW